MSSPIYQSAEEVLAANPPIPVTLMDDWWTRKGDGVGTVQARGNNALVTCGEYLGTFSWSAVLQALNDPGKSIRLPIHAIAYLREIAKNPAKATTIKYLRGPRET